MLKNFIINIYLSVSISGMVVLRYILRSVSSLSLLWSITLLTVSLGSMSLSLLTISLRSVSLSLLAVSLRSMGLTLNHRSLVLIKSGITRSNKAWSSQWFSNSFSFVGNLWTENMIFFDQVLKSTLQFFNSFVFVDNSLNYISSVHRFSDKSRFSLISISISIVEFFHSCFKSDIFLFFNRSKFISNSNKFFLISCELLPQFIIFTLLFF